MSEAMNESELQAARMIKELVGHFGAGFVLRRVGVQIGQTNRRFKLTGVELARVDKWAHEMLDEGINDEPSTDEA